MHKYTQKIIFCAEDTAQIRNNLKTGDKTNPESIQGK